MVACGYVRALLIVVLLATTASAASAAGAITTDDVEVVVVASSDATFRAALAEALAPTGMRVIATTDEAPTVAQLSVTARAIAEREHATSTVWLIVDTSKTTLVTYDLDVDRALVREVPYAAPLTATQAAEIARMARTMLRTLRVTPELDLPLPPVRVARVERSRATFAARVAPLVPPNREPAPGILAASVGASLRVGAPASDAGFDGRVSVWWRLDGLGLALHASVATRGTLETMTFAGRISDHSLAATVHALVLRGPRVHVIGLAGLAIHAVTIEGVLGSTPVQVLRFDPAVRLGLVGSYELGQRLEVGIAMSADGLLRRQRYESSADEIVVVPRLQLTTGVIASLRFL